MNIVILIIAAISILYLGTSIYKANRIPESISETAYIWEQDCMKAIGTNGSHKAHLFSLYCAIVAILLFWPWISHTHENLEFLCFLGCAGILAAAITPFFKEKYQAPIHYGGGILAMISWFIWMKCMGYIVELIAAFIVIILLTTYKKESYIFWIETVGLAALILCLL